MDTGWIKLHRQIQDHWIYKEKPFSKFQAWVDLLLSANHKDNKVVLGNRLINCERGQLITSIHKLCDRWGWSNTKVKNFLDLLQSDAMIAYKSDAKTTVLTIVNYGLYQDRNDEETTEKHHRNDTETTQKRRRNDAETTQKHTNKNDKEEVLVLSTVPSTSIDAVPSTSRKNEKNDKNDKKDVLVPPDEIQPDRGVHSTEGGVGGTLAPDGAAGADAPASPQTTGDGAQSDVENGTLSAKPAAQGMPQKAGRERKLAAGKSSEEEYSPEFEEFWSVYPRRVEKRRAWKNWKARIRDDRVSPDEMILAARNYASYIRSRGTPEEYIKHPATFLSKDKPFKDFLEAKPANRVVRMPRAYASLLEWAEGGGGDE